jgi:hypothetical protein
MKRWKYHLLHLAKGRKTGDVEESNERTRSRRVGACSGDRRWSERDHFYFQTTRGIESGYGNSNIPFPTRARGLVPSAPLGPSKAH